MSSYHKWWSSKGLPDETESQFNSLLTNLSELTDEPSQDLKKKVEDLLDQFKDLDESRLVSPQVSAPQNKNKKKKKGKGNTGGGG
jgi:hypothetical protein